ncbi:MAG: anhydro-N-acetylmuramic acid kinase [Panacagrimonas sp.]
MRERFIGVISGTSQDGIDAVLAEFIDGRFCGILGHATGHYDSSLRAELVELSRESTPVELSRWAELDRRVADAFADTVLDLLKTTAVDPGSVRAVGSHGQTVFHDAVIAQSSLQLGDPSRIAVRTGLAVVADFRRIDVALGGQGAPLLPVFHHAVFADEAEPRAVLNLGGISNLTLLPNRDPLQVRGFDCGPASCLMDEWIERHLGRSFDDNGAWAAGGRLEPNLLAALLAEPYFGLPSPKSTGRGLFKLAWVEARAPELNRYEARDVQRTLCELTARTVADALLREAPESVRLIVCGGGVRNGFLMSRLRELLPAVTVQSAAGQGLDPQLVEATAFAWLACRRLRREPGNLPSVTGARSPAVLGGLFEPGFK